MAKTFNESTLTTSNKLMEIQQDLPDKNITLKQLIEVMSSEGVQFLIIILLAPFLIPASIPGSSTPFGILIILLELAFFVNKALYVPNFIGKYELSKNNVSKLFEILEKVLGYLEKISKPRGELSTKKYILQINAIVSIVLALQQVQG